ncbi:MAG: ribosome maturation factor RimP [Clostridia bacterium]|nr:ribosome maturation factor RimP [Clostridia bacterium]
MSGKNLTRIVFELVEGPVASLGLELVDVELVREGKNKARILRLIIDKKGGVTIDDCTAVSMLVDPLIDSRPDICGHDFFEVSSPGLDRPLKTTRDLLRHVGDLVEVKLYRALNGQKTFQGKLAPCTETEIILDLEDGSQLTVERSMVARIKQVVQF